MFQVVSQKIVGRDVKGIGDVNDQLKTWVSPGCFNVAYMLCIDSYSISQIFLRYLLFRPVMLNSLAYAFVIYGQNVPPFPIGPHKVVAYYRQVLHIATCFPKLKMVLRNIAISSAILAVF